MAARKSFTSLSNDAPVWLAGLLLLGTAALSRYLDKRRPQSAPAARGRAPATGAFGTTRSTDEWRELQCRRVREPGRGRNAVHPWQIPWRGWKDILWRCYKELNEDRLLAVAAGVVFLGLLAMFPAVTAAVSSYGLFVSYASIDQHLAIAANLLPPGAFDIVREQVARIVSKGDAKLSLGFALGLGLALWSANAGMKAIIDALNVVYEEDEKRSFLKLNLLSLALTGGAIVTVLIALSAVVVVPLLLAFFGLGTWGATILALLRWPALFVFVVMGLAVLYRYGPSRSEPRWEWVSVGTIFAAFAWIVGSGLFSWYLSNFANYDQTYGSLGAAIGLMMWMWVSSIIILFGAELNSEMEHQTARDTTTNAARPLGQRGAAMADTVGAAR